MKQPFYTYLLRCADGSYYTGKTNNLVRRLRQHNGEIAGGAKYTRVRRPVQLIYQKSFSTHKEACHHEAQLKRLSHPQKASLSLGSY
ncbi:MAG TPA: GIY-YIG nuclease family protein [Patescibacteria group bacterium]|nr:GIY-YIG nuclease family protein [Patescibacteria group bacterium]